MFHSWFSLREGKRETRGNKENVNDKREIVIGSRNSKEKRKRILTIGGERRLKGQ